MWVCWILIEVFYYNIMEIIGDVWYYLFWFEKYFSFFLYSNFFFFKNVEDWNKREGLIFRVLINKLLEIYYLLVLLFDDILCILYNKVLE